MDTDGRRSLNNGMQYISCGRSTLTLGVVCMPVGLYYASKTKYDSIEKHHIACGQPCGWCSEYAGGGRSDPPPGTGGSVGSRPSVAHPALPPLLGVLTGAALTIVFVVVFETPTLLVPTVCASLRFASQVTCVVVRYRAFVFCLPRPAPDTSPDRDSDAFDPSVQGVFMPG